MALPEALTPPRVWSCNVLSTCSLVQPLAIGIPEAVHHLTLMTALPGGGFRFGPLVRVVSVL